jgi:hypothetical protein
MSIKDQNGSEIDGNCYLGDVFVDRSMVRAVIGSKSPKLSMPNHPSASKTSAHVCLLCDGKVFSQRDLLLVKPAHM